MCEMFVQKFQGLFCCAHPLQLLLHAAKCSAVRAALQANQTPEDDRNKINITLWYQRNTRMVKDNSSIRDCCNMKLIIFKAILQAASS